MKGISNENSLIKEELSGQEISITKDILKEGILLELAPYQSLIYTYCV